MGTTFLYILPLHISASELNVLLKGTALPSSLIRLLLPGICDTDPIKCLTVDSKS
jgi:hypothetical protein